MRHSVCRGACEIIVAPGLPVLLQGGEQHVRAIGTLASLSSCSCERLPPPPWATQASPPSSLTCPHNFNRRVRVELPGEPLPTDLADGAIRARAFSIRGVHRFCAPDSLPTGQ